jgi:hypothetical protein
MAEVDLSDAEKIYIIHGVQVILKSHTCVLVQTSWRAQPDIVNPFPAKPKPPSLTFAAIS